MSDNTSLNFKISNLSDEMLVAFDIVKTLQDNGFEAFWAGGAIRDMILGLDVHDIDIATSAKPDQIIKIFPQAYDRGKSFGVMAIKIKEFEFEIATFRSDLGVADHRRPAAIKFVSAEEDAKRRDFTINGLFYDPISSQIIDYVGGLTDLKRNIIKFIGVPEERIDEDYLRMLRAVRFATRLKFKIEEKTAEAIKSNYYHVKNIAIERIREEFSKMLLLENRVEALELLEKLKILEELIPELNVMHNVPQPPEFHSEGDVWTHTTLALKNIGQTNSEELVWAVLLHDIAKPQTIGYRNAINKTSITFFDHDVQSAKLAKEILERFKFSARFVNDVTWAINQHMRIVHAFRGMGERKQKKLFCDDNIQLLLDLTKADLSASLRPGGKQDMQLYNDAIKLREKFEKESSEEEKRQMKKFDLITGKDIMNILSIEASPRIGQIKTEIEKAYLDGQINTRDEAIALIKDYND